MFRTYMYIECPLSTCHICNHNASWSEGGWLVNRTSHKDHIQSRMKTFIYSTLTYLIFPFGPGSVVRIDGNIFFLILRKLSVKKVPPPVCACVLRSSLSDSQGHEHPGICQELLDVLTSNANPISIL